MAKLIHHLSFESNAFIERTNIQLSNQYIFYFFKSVYYITVEVQIFPLNDNTNLAKPAFLTGFYMNRILFYRFPFEVISNCDFR